MERYAIGIDVDKKTFKVCMQMQFSHNERKVKGSRTFKNNPSGFEELVSWVNKKLKGQQVLNKDISMVMEATGTYHEQLAYYLHAEAFQVHIVLPLKSKRYLQSIGLRSKNDQIDAKGLSCMGLEQPLEIWEPVSEQMLQLRSLTRQIESLQVHKTSFQNQLEGITHAVVTHPKAKESLEKIIAELDEQIVLLEKQVAACIQADELLSEKYRLFANLKGVGIMSFAVVAAETGGFALFKNQRQLVCYAGYDIMEDQSGKRVGKTRISKKGNSHIRRAMHMASLSVVRSKRKPFIDLYQRVYERRGIKMKGYVAVQRKLLVTMYAIWKKDQTFKVDYQKETSGIHEHKLLFPVIKTHPEGIPFKKEKTATVKTVAALDELPCNHSHEVLFPVMQKYKKSTT